jgi:hypothetical protein
MSQTSASSSSPPRYWSTATGVITLPSLVAGVLISQLIPGLVLTALALVVAFFIWRIRMLRYRGGSFWQISWDRWVWGSAACVAVLTLLFFTTLSNESNGATAPVQASPRVAEVAGCMKAHGLGKAYQQLPTQELSGSTTEEPRPGDAKARRLFAWCDWPRPSWAQADGFTEITVTELQGPDAYAVGNDLAYRIKAPCHKLKMAFTHVHQDTGIEKPFTSEVGSLVAQDGSPWEPRADQLYADMRNAFAPRRYEVVVISGSHSDLDYVECVA